MAFAQLTYRESLRDIEACLRVQSSKLYHLGFRSSIARNTLANANATRDWRIYCDFAQSLIGTARRLYADEALGLDLKDTVYALDATTIDLCLSVFPWAPFRSTKAAVKLPTLLDLRGNIPSFISDEERLGRSPADGGARRSDEADRRDRAVERDHGRRIGLVPDVGRKLGPRIEPVQAAAGIVRVSR